MQVSEHIERKADEICHNRTEVEQAWAVKAFMLAEEHEKLLNSTPRNAMVELSGCDEELYMKFRILFPKLEVGILNEDELKSTESKKSWTPFCMGFEKTLEDFNFGTLLRIDASKGYSEENTTIVPRVQFLCIEAARMREKKNIALMAQENPEAEGKVFSLQRCRVCGGESSKICSRCKSARYCSVECQTKDWPKHKKDCSTQNVHSLLSSNAK